MTGIEYLMKLYQLIAAQSEGVKRTYFLIDFKQYVPKEKQQTWDERKERSSVKPYPKTFLFNDNEMINVERLSASGEILRKALYQYILQHPPTELTTDVILDIDPQNGPLCYPSGTQRKEWSAWNQRAPGQESQASGLTLLGEPDVRQFYHMKRYPRGRFVSVSEDGDQFPTTLGFLMKCAANDTMPESFIWERPGKGGKPTMYYNMLQLYYDLVKVKPIHIWIFICINCGTDFLKKNLITDGFGMEVIARAVLTGWHEIQFPRNSNWIDSFLRYLWWTKSKKGPLYFPKTYKQLQTFKWQYFKNKQLPTDEDKDLAKQRVLMNWNYWTDEPLPVPPQPEEQRLEPEPEPESPDRLVILFNEWKLANEAYSLSSSNHFSA